MRSGLQTAATSIALALCAAAQATISLPTVTPAPIPAGTLITDGGGATLDNFVSHDLYANTSADWTISAIVVELAAGSIYQDAVGFGNGPASPTLISLAPSVEYDTYVTTTGTFTSIEGAAGDLGDLVPKFDETTGLSMSWHAFAADENNIGATRIGRFTFSDDAQGSWSLAVNEKYSRNSKFLYNPIINGEMIVNPLQGDLTFDGFVGIDDLNRILGSWNQTVTVGDRATGDPSGDGFVGIEDLNIVLGNWNGGLVPLQPDTVPYLERDLDRDGFVGIDDQNILISNWNLTVPPGDPRGDPSGDNFVGIEDKVNGNWNAGTPPAPVGGYTPPVVIPEPGTIALVGTALCLLACKRR
jgi:hypothetical protein